MHNKETPLYLRTAELSTLAIHADEHLAGSAEVAPCISVSTTFRLPEDVTANNFPTETHVYSRESTPLRSRLESVLGAVHDNGHAVTYGAGLAATFALLLHLKPRRVALGVGYHGSKATLDLYMRKVAAVEVISIDAPYKSGDLVWLENPVNPTGEVVDVRHYADRAHANGALLLVDATLAPPPLQQPFRQGADFVLHSSAKYLGGHSDSIGGIIVTRCCKDATELRVQRTLLGSTMGSLETWLLLRSLRTLEIRVLQQSRIATQLVAWLHTAVRGRPESGLPVGVISKIYHASLQKLPPSMNVCEAFPHGFGAVFTLEFHSQAHAKRFPYLLRLSQAATSFGAVHTTMEWRHAIDLTQSPKTLRVSIGLEALSDLKQDWCRALNALKFGEDVVKHKL
ncbi:hypothetical protein IWQ61_005455 [Dispira simplex]|nr:hypothetical protein IWQ61_005455 [Dispira simplex]